MTGGSRDMSRFVPWPFPDGAFPRELGAVVQLTVLEGEMPALLVVHFRDGDWAIGDGVNDPNEPGAAIATHIWHAIDRDPSIGDLASLAPGCRATRNRHEDPWVIAADDEE